MHVERYSLCQDRETLVLSFCGGRGGGSKSSSLWWRDVSLIGVGGECLR